jgi:hypothetical protein
MQPKTRIPFSDNLRRRTASDKHTVFTARLIQ